MTKKLVLVLVVMALVAVAGNVPKAGTYQFTLSRQAAINGSVLQPGDYKLVVRDTNAVVTAHDGRTAEATVKIETAPAKFPTTAVTIQVHDGKPVISEIDLGGSKTKLLFAQ